MRSLEGQKIINSRSPGVMVNGEFVALTEEQINETIENQDQVFDPLDQVFDPLDQVFDPLTGECYNFWETDQGFMYVPCFKRPYCRFNVGDPEVEFTPGSSFYISRYSPDENGISITNIVGHPDIININVDDIPGIEKTDFGLFYMRFVLVINEKSELTLIDLLFSEDGDRDKFLKIDRFDLIGKTSYEAPPLMRTSWGGGFGSLQDHWNKDA